MSARWLIPFLALSLLALAATCGDGDDDLDGVHLNAGITGRAMVGPMCPVVQEGTECPDQPLQVEITVLDDDGDEVATFETGEDGRFSLGLFPGRYTIDPQVPPGGPPPQAERQTVDVVDGEYTEVLVQYDSGIR